MLNENKILFDPYQGFIRGNMFESIFDQYGNIYSFKPINEQAKLLTYLDMLEFACIDIGLYLDIYNDDNKKIEYYNELNKEKKRILDEYESKFGPIELCSDYLNRSPWSWDNDPWPWEV